MTLFYFSNSMGFKPDNAITVAVNSLKCGWAFKTWTIHHDKTEILEPRPIYHNSTNPYHLYLSNHFWIDELRFALLLGFGNSSHARNLKQCPFAWRVSRIFQDDTEALEVFDCINAASFMIKWSMLLPDLGTLQTCFAGKNYVFKTLELIWFYYNC